MYSDLPPRPVRGLPTVLVTGVDDVATVGATMTLAWDLPDAVVVRHHIDVETQRLHRTISDLSGILEREAESDKPEPGATSTADQLGDPGQVTSPL